MEELKTLFTDLIKVHSSLCSLTNQEVKNSINKLILELFEQLYLYSDEFENHIKTDVTVYCYTRESIKSLQNREKRGEHIILCTSLKSDGYNYSSSLTMPYTHKYSFKISKSCYGLYLNSFGCVEHENEEEILLPLSSVEMSSIKQLKL